VKAIQTRYAGCRFRSRLEARWAVFFDALGLAWEYEPQGFVLDDGTPYLPDFWIPECNTWFEVKGKPPTQAERRTLARFANELPMPDDRSGMLRSSAALAEAQYLKVAVGDIPPSPPGRPGLVGSSSQGEVWASGLIWRVLPFGVDDYGAYATENYVAARWWQVCPEGHRYVGWGWCWRCDIAGHDDPMAGAYPPPHHPRIVAAGIAARSARFEHGEKGAA